MKTFLKKAYYLLPFKKRLFCIVRWFNIPEKIFKHLTFTGIFTVKVKKNAKFQIYHYGYQLENELFWKGMNGWEKESFACWIKEVEKSKIIFDIGANTGIYSLIAKSVNKRAEIYAFEPVERVFEKLNKNVKLNSYCIKTFKEAIFDKTGTCEIWDYKLEHEYAASLIKPDIQTNIYILYNVPVISLDDFIEKNNIAKIDLIKIDTEASEPYVLDGYSKYFTIHRPTLLIEVLYDHIGEKIQTFIDKSGIPYDFFFIDEENGLIKKDLIRRNSDKYFNYLLKPKNISL